MEIIEPCCFHKQMDNIVSRAENGNPVVVATWGDVTFPQWLDNLVRRAPGAEVMLVLVRVYPTMLSCLKRLMEEKTSDGNWLISSLTLISRGADHEDCIHALGIYRSLGRAVICEDKVAVRLCTVISPSRSFFVSGALHQRSEFALHLWQLSASRSMAEDVSTFFHFQKKRKSV